MTRLRLVPLLALGLSLTCATAYASSPQKPTLSPDSQWNELQQSAGETCKHYVSFRLGSLLSLNVTQVSAPKPPSMSWIVVGEDKSKTPAISFICHMRPGNQGWELEKLDLLQLAEPTLAQSASVSAFNR